MTRRPYSTFEPPAFQPAPWLPGRHLQTMMGRWLRKKNGVTFRRERIETADGDFVDLDFADVLGSTWTDLGEHAPIALLLHGLEGSARSGYAYETYRQLAANGVRPVGMNFRSCSGEMNRNPRLYHSGDTADAAAVMALLAQRYPDVLRGAIGFSLGGNVLLKYLGECGEDAHVDAAVSVSVPFRLGDCAARLDQGFSRLYRWNLMRKLRGKVAAKAGVLAEACSVPTALDTQTFREFDDAVTAPLHGFENADDYYARSSSEGFLNAIRVPTLLLQSWDDPFVFSVDAAHTLARENPYLNPSFQSQGGHVGFVAGGVPWRPTFWAESTAGCYFGEVLSRT